jgi:cytochrome P450
MWVAARASSVAQVFADRACRVRSVTERVPAALAGRAAGEIFRHLVRMNDGDRHSQPKLVLQRALSSVANLVGLLSQTYEATAGLIGNSIVALAGRG